AVYNINGQRVAGLRNEWQQAGTHSLRWNSRDDAGNPVPSGIYIVRLKAGDFSDSIKLLLLK
ncbi:T9SS type A sorting domain-containing protein, partial [candidate division KSB1 bacterium]|nr:T9SS type A sorting domain-containing protein [candidate division KSB1 bacterium]